MFREPIFDIWDDTNKKMYFNLGLKQMAMGSELFDRDDCYLLQHLGIEDRNGRALREGDIIRNMKIKETAVIAWEERTLQYVAKNKTGYQAIVWTDSLWERVGTIYESPELVEL